MTDAAGTPPDFPDIPGFVEVFNRHGLRYVVIGGIAARAWSPELRTDDVDFTPATDRDNLERLSAALYELGARVRTDAVSEGLVFRHDASSLIGAKMERCSQCRDSLSAHTWREPRPEMAARWLI